MRLLVASPLGMSFEPPFEKTGLWGLLVVVTLLALLSAAVWWAARRRWW